MSLKEEVEKLIRSERAKIQSRDKKHEEYHERQRERFRPMCALLEELAASVDQDHILIEVHALETSATITVGSREGGNRFETEISWSVEPNFDVDWHGDRGESLFNEEPGFKVEETRYGGFDLDASDYVQHLTFETESDVMQYIVPKVADRIAFYQHCEELKEKHSHSKGDDS
ncbi:MAG: hypothetical protein OEU49_14570 [Chromatiales bacterium]|nr:hypothetical protein [Chromatiales bacterium]